MSIRNLLDGSRYTYRDYEPEDTGWYDETYLAPAPAPVVAAPAPADVSETLGLSGTAAPVAADPLKEYWAWNDPRYAAEDTPGQYGLLQYWNPVLQAAGFDMSKATRPVFETVEVPVYDANENQIGTRTVTRPKMTSMGESGMEYQAEEHTPEYYQAIDALRSAGYDVRAKNPDADTYNTYYGIIGPGNKVLQDIKVKGGNASGWDSFGQALLDFAPIALQFIPGVGTAIGTALGATGTAATVLGNAVIQGGLTAARGGDLEDVLKSAAISGGISYATPYIKDLGSAGGAAAGIAEGMAPGLLAAATPAELAAVNAIASAPSLLSAAAPTITDAVLPSIAEGMAPGLLATDVAGAASSALDAGMGVYPSTGLVVPSALDAGLGVYSLPTPDLSAAIAASASDTLPGLLADNALPGIAEGMAPTVAVQAPPALTPAAMESLIGTPGYGVNAAAQDFAQAAGMDLGLVGSGAALPFEAMVDPASAASTNTAGLSSEDRAALRSNEGYGSGMSGTQTSVYDSVLSATGNKTVADLFANAVGTGSSVLDWLKDNPTAGRALFSAAGALLNTAGASSGSGSGGYVDSGYRPTLTDRQPVIKQQSMPVTPVSLILPTTGQANSGLWRYGLLGG